MKAGRPLVFALEHWAEVFARNGGECNEKEGEYGVKFKWYALQN